MLHYLCDTPHDRDKTPSAIGSAILMSYLPVSCIHMRVGVLNRLVPGEAQPHDTGALDSETTLVTLR